MREKTKSDAGGTQKKTMRTMAMAMANAMLMVIRTSSEREDRRLDASFVDCFFDRYADSNDDTVHSDETSPSLSLCPCPSLYSPYGRIVVHDDEEAYVSLCVVFVASDSVLVVRLSR